LLHPVPDELVKVKFVLGSQKVLVEFKEFDPRDSCRSRLSSSRARVVTPRRSSQLLLHRVG